MKIRTRPSLCVWIFTFAYQTISTYRQRRRGGLARPGSWARRGRQCRVCKLWGKGWGLCKQVFMSRSEDLPITVCPSFYPFLICQSAGTDFLIFNIWSRLHACFLLLTEPTNLILMADRSGACLMLVLIFITRHCQLILTHGPWSSPSTSHHTSPLQGRFLVSPQSWERWSGDDSRGRRVITCERFPISRPSLAVIFFSADPRHWDLGSCFLPQSQYFAFNQANSHPIPLRALPE